MELIKNVILELLGEYSGKINVKHLAHSTFSGSVDNVFTDKCTTVSTITLRRAYAVIFLTLHLTGTSVNMSKEKNHD